MKDQHARMIVLMVLMTLLVGYSTQQQTQQFMCKNLNDDSFLNRCYKETPPQALTILSNTVLTWINPRMVATTTAIVYVLLPILLFSNVRIRDIRQSSFARFHNVSISVLNFLHRICFSLVLNIALYVVFRQSRPCSCSTDGGRTWARIGSTYGLPSGDAACAAIVASVIWEWKFIDRTWSRIVAGLLIVVVDMERVILGYHTVGQVMLGSLIGITVHLYSTRTPQWTIYFDSIVQLVGGFILLHFDPTVAYEPNDNNNLFSWYMYGVGFQLFVVWCLSSFFFTRKNFGKLKWTLHRSHGNFFVKGEDQELFDNLMKNSRIASDLTSDQQGVVALESEELKILGNVRWTMCGFVILFISNLISSWITQDAIYFSK